MTPRPGSWRSSSGSSHPGTDRMRLRIGTRGSRLALAQAEEVAGLLRERGHETEIVPMTTAGDRGASPAASPTGTKGLFVAEITDALSRGEVDLAVHSAKDLPSEDPPGIEVASVPERSLPYDVLVSRAEGLPDRPVVGTSSLRRRAQLVRLHPEAVVRDLRGNVDTRLRRVAEGHLDALVLAAAGLSRLGLTPEHVRPLPVDDMVPAPGQGALAVQARADDDAAEAARAVDHRPSRTAFETERRVVTRPHPAGEVLARRLRALGAEAIAAPTIGVERPIAGGELDDAVRDAAEGRFDWTVFTSAAGVEAWFERAEALGVGPPRSAVAAIGDATAEALRARGVEPTLIPPEFTTEALGRAFPEGRGRVLLARADLATAEL